MFNGRRLLIATMHRKEQVLTSLLQDELGVKCFISENFNTDLFGTFSGEVEKKCSSHNGQKQMLKSYVIGRM